MNIPIIPTKQYLDDLRFKANLSDERIAEIVGLSRTTIWKLRNGRHKTTATEYGIRIANLHAQTLRGKQA